MYVSGAACGLWSALGQSTGAPYGSIQYKRTVHVQCTHVLALGNSPLKAKATNWFCIQWNTAEHGLFSMRWLRLRRGGGWVAAAPSTSS